MKRKKLSLSTAVVFLFFLLALSGISAEADSERKNGWAAGFVSDQVYRIEFVSGDSSLFLACDEEGNLALTADETDEDTAWKAKGSYGQEFTLKANDFSLNWEKGKNGETPKLTASKSSMPGEKRSLKYYNLIVKMFDEMERMAEKPITPPDRPGGGRTTNWVYAYGSGTGTLSGTLDGDNWFVTLEDGKPGASRSKKKAAVIRLRTEGKGGGSVIIGAPSTVSPLIKDSGNTQDPKFTVPLQLPTGAAPEYSWTVDDETCSDEQELILKNSSDLSIGVHRIRLTVRFVDEYGTEFCQTSWPVNFIVCSGILDNSLLTFSDVHESFENIGTAIEEIITVYDGKIPALVVCTGDWTNVHPKADAETVNSYHVPMMKAQIGGIDTVFVSGNHEPEASAIAANEEAGLGYDNSTGLLFSSASGSQGTSAKTKNLIVFGINYDEVTVKDEEKTVYSYENVCQKLRTILDGLKDQYQDEYILISSHSGLHVLGKQEESSCEEWAGNNSYNVNMSSDMVDLLNEYADNYGMRFIYFFGHDHSRNETEFLLEPGDEIISTVSFDDMSTSGPKAISFTYGHAGYLTNSINGHQKYTFLVWNRTELVRDFRQVGNLTAALDIPLPDPDPVVEPVINPVPGTEAPFFFRIGDPDQPSWPDRLPETGFSARSAVPLSVRPANVIYKNLDMYIQIPTLNVDAALVTVPVVDDNWAISWLGSSAGLLEGSALPGEGTAILAGHNTLNTTEYGPFALLADMEIGDLIFISKAGQPMKSFRVYANELLLPDDMEKLASVAGQAENALVLVTCENEAAAGGYLNRRVVFAEPR